ncbi:MAG: leucine--tRNA ligase [Candidatus Nanoarchaeia archaeon]
MTKSRELQFFHDVESKWQKKWAEDKVFEPGVNEEKEKYFLTFPYPYINAYPHIGHLYTLVRVDAFARYKRSRGYNVLFPQGWHVTGSPIISAAKRVKEREEKQIKMMRDMGIPEEEIPKFEEPEYWIEFFRPKFRECWSDMGASVDWRREFITTSLNPHYDKFIKWQFNKLREGNFVIKGRFPVVWDPKENVAVGDHDRVEGEGEVPQEYVLLRFDMGEYKLVAATLRPETVYGQTNLWVNPEIEYVKARVNDENWIISEDCANKLEEQDNKVEITGNIRGSELIGQKVKAPVVENKIPVLPASFPSAEKGTGIVTSVPSDAPDDYMGLIELQNNPEELQKFGVSAEMAKIEPIPIINSSDLGDVAAKKMTEELGIKSINEREKLERAKKEVYKKGFYEGTMLAGKYKGEKVEFAKDKIKKELVESGEAVLFYELTGRVVSRNLSECIVKIVSDQWFLNYADSEWKKLAHKCLDKMALYPEKARQQFNYVIDWLHEWACTREEGLGTKLPWDEKWLIESLSDSTIYMAYYTIAHRITQIDAEKLDDNFFDYVFLGKEAPLKVEKKFADELRKEFNYWYPVDFRNSGKDLIQNHLTFFIFNHTAIFPEDKWPAGIGVNGWVTVDGEKMSKSRGNVIPIKKIVTDYGPDVPRITILSGGEELDDPNWDSSFANNLVGKLYNWYELATENKDLREEYNKIDAWMESRLHEIIKNATEAMDKTLFRTAFQAIFFELSKYKRWYLKRVKNVPNKRVWDELVTAQTIMLQPYCPHVCEEVWEKLGKGGYASVASWPEYDESKIEKDTEWLITQLINDINTAKRLAKIDEVKKIKVIMPHSWKYELYDMLAKSKKDNPKEAVSEIMQTHLREHGQEIMKIAPKIIKAGSVPQYMVKQEEKATISEAKEFLQDEFGCEIELLDAEESSEKKAGSAQPGKPAIVLE